MPDDAYTEQPVVDATPVPPLMECIFAVPVFAVIAWGMFLLFGQRPYEFGPSGDIVPIRPEGKGLEPDGDDPPDPPDGA